MRQHKLDVQLLHTHHRRMFSLSHSFDWTDGSWTTSPETYTVLPGDVISSSTAYVPSERAYTMVISSRALGKSIRTTYALKPRQTAPESTVYFVLEHQPRTCAAYPSSAEATFENIHVEVDHQLVEWPEWKAALERPACDSVATVVDARTIRFTWDPNDARPSNTPVQSDESAGGSAPTSAPQKWGYGAPPLPANHSMLDSSSQGSATLGSAHDELPEACCSCGTYPPAGACNCYCPQCSLSCCIC